MAYIQPDTKIYLAVKPKHPTRKAVAKVIDNDIVTGDFYETVVVTSIRQAEAISDTAFIAIILEDKLYPVKDSEIREQYNLVLAGEAPTVEASDDFGVPGLTGFVHGPEESGHNITDEVLGVKLEDIQENIEINAGIVVGSLKKVYNFTEFNPSNTAEQNGYYLVFCIEKAKAEAAGWSDIKFGVAGGKSSTKESAVTVDEGMNIIYLGKTADIAANKTLLIFGTNEEVEKVYNFTMKTEFVSFGTEPVPGNMSSDDTSTPNDDDPFPNPEPSPEPLKPSPVTTTNEGTYYYLNGNTATVKEVDGKMVISIDGCEDYEMTTETKAVYCGGAAGEHFTKAKLTLESGTLDEIDGGGYGTVDNSSDVDNVEIVINGGTVKNTIYGGGTLKSTVKDLKITINGGTVKNVTGGGCAYVDSKNNLDALFSKTPENSTCIVNNATITMNDGTITYAIFGGGQSYAAVKNSKIIVNGGDMSKAYLIAGGSNGYTKSGTLEINNGTVNIAHIINRGWMEDGKITVSGGIVNNLYPLAEDPDRATASMNNHGVKNKSVVRISGGEVKKLGAGYDYNEAVQPDSPKIDIEVSNSAVVGNIEEAKTSFGTSIVVK